MSKDDKWCFAWYQDPRVSDAEKKAALVKDSKWPTPNPTISVGFMDGTPQQKELVKRFAEGWKNDSQGKLANLTFNWTTPDKADVRVTFKYDGSWSVIGTTCKNVPKNQPTMNFGWLDPGVSDDEARRVILHEFGHALGLIHEHQNPVHAIKWNKDAVIADLSGPPNNWDMDTIEHNMFEKYPRNDINGTKLDTTSIMMYPIPASWTLDGTHSDLNTDLSKVDKRFIRQQYP